MLGQQPRKLKTLNAVPGSGTLGSLQQQAQQQQQRSLSRGPQHAQQQSLFTRNPAVENAAHSEVGLRPEQVHERSIRELTELVTAHRQKKQMQQQHQRQPPAQVQAPLVGHSTRPAAPPSFYKPLVEAPSAAAFRQQQQQQQQQFAESKRSAMRQPQQSRSTLDREFDSDTGSEDEHEHGQDALYDPDEDTHEDVEEEAQPSSLVGNLEVDSKTTETGNNLLKRIMQLFGPHNDRIVTQCKDLQRAEQTSSVAGSESLFTISEQNVIRNARLKKLSNMRVGLYDNMERLYQQRAQQIKKMSDNGEIDSFDEQMMQSKQADMHAALREFHSMSGGEETISRVRSATSSTNTQAATQSSSLETKMSAVAASSRPTSAAAPSRAPMSMPLPVSSATPASAGARMAATMSTGISTASSPGALASHKKQPPQVKMAPAAASRVVQQQQQPEMRMQLASQPQQPQQVPRPVAPRQTQPQPQVQAQPTSSSAARFAFDEDEDNGDDQCPYMPAASKTTPRFSFDD
jgi:hypothetical protein